MRTIVILAIVFLASCDGLGVSPSVPPTPMTGIPSAEPTAATPHDPSLSGRRPASPPTPQATTAFPFNSQVALGDLTFIDKDEGWLGLSDPTGAYLLHTQDGGVTWSRLSAPAFGHVAFVDPRHGWILATSLFGTVDGGVSWHLVVKGGARGGADPTISHFRAVDSTHAWILSSPSDCTEAPFCPVSVVATTDGVDWQIVSEQLAIADIAFVDALTGWATFVSRAPASSPVPSGEAAIAVTHDGGHTWRRQFHATGSSPYLSVAFIDRLRGWALGSDLAYCSMGGCGGYTLYRTTDGGAHWDTIRSAEPRWWGPTPEGASAAGFVGSPLFVKASDGWLSAGTGAGPGGGGVLVTHDAGVSWHRFNGEPGTFWSVRSLAAIESTRAWVVTHIFSATGHENAVMVTTDGGDSWQRELSWSWSYH